MLGTGVDEDVVVVLGDVEASVVGEEEVAVAGDVDELALGGAVGVTSAAGRLRKDVRSIESHEAEMFS